MEGQVKGEVKGGKVWEVKLGKLGRIIEGEMREIKGK